MRCNLHMVKFQHPLLPPWALPPRNKKLSSFEKTSTIWKSYIYLCRKNVTTIRGSPKSANTPPPPPCGKRDPPHIEKMSPHGENVYTFCTHRRKCPHIGEKKPPCTIFYSCSAPPPPPPSGERLLFCPLATADHDLDPLTLFCLFERVRKKSTKIK